MSRGIPHKTKMLTFSALLAAIGVAIIFVGSLIETLDLSMAALASFFCLFAVLEIRGVYPWLIFSVTGILSVVLMPYNLGGWFYLLFFGYYPILKNIIERLKKPLAWTIKLLICNAAMIAGVLTIFYLLTPDTSGKTVIDAFGYAFGVAEFGAPIVIGVYLLANVTFVVYDIALSKLIVVYYFKIRKKLKFLK